MLYLVAMILPNANGRHDVHSSSYLIIDEEDSRSKWENAWTTYNPWAYLFDCVKEKYPHVVDAGMGWVFSGFTEKNSTTYFATFIGRKFRRSIHRGDLMGKPAWATLEVEGRRLRVSEIARVSAW